MAARTPATVSSAQNPDTDAQPKIIRTTPAPGGGVRTRFRDMTRSTSHTTSRQPRNTSTSDSSRPGAYTPPRDRPPNGSRSDMTQATAQCVGHSRESIADLPAQAGDANHHQLYRRPTLRQHHQNARYSRPRRCRDTDEQAISPTADTIV